MSTDQCGNPITATTPTTKIERVRQQAKLNKASDDKFIFVIDVPKCVRYSKYDSSRACDAANVDDLLLSVFSVNVPAITLPAEQLPYGGLSISLPSHSRQVEPLNVQYIINSQYTNYWILWQWAEFIASAKHGFTGQDSEKPVAGSNQPPYNVPPSDYLTNGSLFALGNYNDVVAEWEFEGCVLTEIQGIQYNDQSGDQLTGGFTVEYAFASFRLH